MTAGPLKVSLGELAGLVVPARRKPQQKRTTQRAKGCKKCEPRLRQIATLQQQIKYWKAAATGKNPSVQTWHKHHLMRLKEAGVCARCRGPVGESPSIVACAACHEKKLRKERERLSMKWRQCATCRDGRCKYSTQCRACAAAAWQRRRIVAGQ